MTLLPSAAAIRAVSAFVREHPCWTAFWDKRHGVWRVTQDDPDSDLYAEAADAEAEDVVGMHPLGGDQRVGAPELPLVEGGDVPHAHADTVIAYMTAHG